MPLVFRTAGPWGAGKGSNLTPAEVDGNFYTLDQLIADLTTALLPVGIADITLIGNQLTFELDDTTTFGPFTTPTASLRWRGEWDELIAYARNDIIAVGPAIYIVLIDHTSVFPFNGSRQIGGLPVYQVMLASSIGGGVFGVSKVFTTADTEYTCAATENGAYMRFSSGADIIVPDNAVVALPIGWTITIRKINDAGTIVVYAANDAVINTPTGFFSEITAGGGVATLIKVDEDEWDIYGDLGT